MTPELIAFAIFAALQLMDFVTTKAVLNKGGYERNKAAKWLMARLGEDLAMF